MTAIKERPILFSAPMVRAILEGRKTVTRRAVKGLATSFAVTTAADESPLNSVCWNVGGPIIHCPYGKPGDRLWVRETFYAFGRWETRFSKKKSRDEWHFVDMTIEQFKAYQFEPPQSYRAGQRGEATPAWWKRPSIFMPRAASRILMEITGVRVERLQDISRSDIRAEGLQCPPGLASDDVTPNYRDWYPAAWRELWESINGSKSWAANPWVWVVEFKQVKP